MGARPGSNEILPKKSFLEIDVPAGTQPCTKFGIHKDLPFVKELYKEGEAAFIANMGSLVVPLPLPKQGAKGAYKRPKGLFSHTVQTTSIQTVHAQNPYKASGVLGRLNEHLTNIDKPYKSAFYSLTGYSKFLEGDWIVPNQVSPDGGVQRFSDFAEMEDDLEKMSMSEHDSYSHVSAAYADILEHALRSTELLGVEMENIKLANDWKSCRKNKWGKQLEQFAKLMKLDTTVLETERAAFVAKVGGYDTHKTPSIEGALKILNEGLECFVHELKAQKIFDNTAIVMVSEFGRSLITNTLSGTDHGWADSWQISGKNEGCRCWAWQDATFDAMGGALEWNRDLVGIGQGVHGEDPAERQKFQIRRASHGQRPVSLLKYRPPGLGMQPDTAVFLYLFYSFPIFLCLVVTVFYMTRGIVVFDQRDSWSENYDLYFFNFTMCKCLFMCTLIVHICMHEQYYYM